MTPNQTRAERKRDERKEKRDNQRVSQADGLTRKELLDAEAELDAFADSCISAHGVTWAALAEQWQAVDYQREGARVAYGRISELRKMGRTVDSDQAVQIYAQTKQELLVLEDQMITFLGNDDLSQEEINSFLWDHRAIPGKPIAIRIPENLRDRLQEHLDKKEASGNGDDEPPPAEDIPSCEGSEVHGRDS